MLGKNWKKPLEESYKHLTVSKEFERLREASRRRLQIRIIGLPQASVFHWPALYFPRADDGKNN